MKIVATSGLIFLATDTKFVNQVTVLGDVLALQVLKKAFALAYHHEQAAACSVVFLELVEVLGKAFDSVSEECDLTFDGASVIEVATEFLEDFVFLLCGKINCHYKKQMCEKHLS